MQNAGYLFSAFTAVWVILFGYVLYLLNKQKKLQEEINSLKDHLKGNKGSDQR
jgi:CcmD family protein